MLLDRCPWCIAGPILGVVIIGLRATVNKPLGALGGYIDVTEHVTRPSRLGFSAFLLAGIVIGGALFTLTTGSFSPSPSYSGLLPANPVLQLGILVVAGLAMAAIGVRALKASGARCIVTGEPVDWSVERPRTHHVAGSILFALGWMVAGTCPGPVAAMIGEGRLVGVPVVVGLLAGVTLQRTLAARKNVEAYMPAPAATGL